ncbi:MAG: 2-isopropylmalate synthase [Oscillospiraceae bacterium]|nr:2-isopropylmalate synthase [Oscillospiraceae bacterium]
MKNSQKYSRGYFMPPEPSLDWTRKEYIDRAPTWCSVDLRDGNQALIIPMSLEEKLEFFDLLVDIGFKEIEVGFPAASETEYEFLRYLIDNNKIPDDVTVQVLTQSRRHIIEKTFEALSGCKNAIVHLYNSTSLAQREQVFKKPMEEIKQIAIDGAEIIYELAEKTPGNFRFEYSPESFTGTEVEFALDVCNAVIDVWKPTAERPVIINLPATVEMSLPHVYASQIEYMSKHLNCRENIIVSLHPHNDRGTGVADAELGLLAGADRIEGTLFGNGERTGNVDIITLGMNMFSHGVDPMIDFSDMPKLQSVYERVTRMRVYERQPYAGSLVFAAFSGSHQDAIAKGMHYREETDPSRWTVPYLPIDPTDVGRIYEADVIRINSQSGKGGIGYLLEQQYGIDMPPKMREDFGYRVKSVSDHQHKELQPKEVYDIFMQEYVNMVSPLDVIAAEFSRKDGIRTAHVTIMWQGKKMELNAEGSGRLDAVSNAIKEATGVNYNLIHYNEHAMTKGSTSDAMAYVGIINGAGKVVWGAGTHNDIITASIHALVSAFNRRDRV